jgi:hypothetical protein
VNPGYFTLVKAGAARREDPSKIIGKRIFSALGLFFVDSF